MNVVVLTGTVLPARLAHQEGTKIRHKTKYAKQIYYQSQKTKSYLLGHGKSLQDRSSSLSPLQSSPPCFGGGLVQDRDRLCVPPPHVTLHCDQAFQLVHLPSTSTKEWNLYQVEDSRFSVILVLFENQIECIYFCYYHLHHYHNHHHHRHRRRRHRRHHHHHHYHHHHHHHHHNHRYHFYYHYHYDYYMRQMV